MDYLITDFVYNDTCRTVFPFTKENKPYFIGYFPIVNIHTDSGKVSYPYRGYVYGVYLVLSEDKNNRHICVEDGDDTYGYYSIKDDNFIIFDNRDHLSLSILMVPEDVSDYKALAEQSANKIYQIHYDSWLENIHVLGYDNKENFRLTIIDSESSIILIDKDKYTDHKEYKLKRIWKKCNHKWILSINRYTIIEFYMIGLYYDRIAPNAIPKRKNIIDMIFTLQKEFPEENNSSYHADTYIEQGIFKDKSVMYIVPQR